MKKLFPLLLCLPLIGYTNFKDTLEEYEYYIGDVEIFEDKGYIQINKIYNDEAVLGYLYSFLFNGNILFYYYNTYRYYYAPFR